MLHPYGNFIAWLLYFTSTKNSQSFHSPVSKKHRSNLRYVIKGLIPLISYLFQWWQRMPMDRVLVVYRHSSSPFFLFFRVFAWRKKRNENQIEVMTWLSSIQFQFHQRDAQRLTFMSAFCLNSMDGRGTFRYFERVSVRQWVELFRNYDIFVGKCKRLCNEVSQKSWILNILQHRFYSKTNLFSISQKLMRGQFKDWRQSSEKSHRKFIAHSHVQKMTFRSSKFFYGYMVVA